MNSLNRLLTGMLLAVFVMGIAYGQTYLINETFGTVPPSGWTNGSPAPTHGTTGQDDAHSLVFEENTSLVSIVTSSITDPDRLTFYHRKSNNNTAATFDVYYSSSSSGPWTSLVSVTPSSNSAYVLSATELSLDTGTYYFKLENDGTKKDVYIDVFQVTQSIVASTSSLTGFFYEPSNGPSSEQSFTVSGSDLTANISVSAPTNYEVSTSSGSGFGSSVSLTQSGGTVNSTTIYVRLKAGLSTGAYNSEDITISSTGKINKTVTCSGDVRASITASTASLSDFFYVTESGPSSEQSFTVSGSDLTANISVSAPTNYEVSTSSGSGFGSSVSLTQSGGTVNSTTIYVRLKAGLSTGAYNSEDITISSTGKVSKTVTCSGDVGPLILNLKLFLEGGLW